MIGSLTRPGQFIAMIGRGARPSARDPSPPERELKGRLSGRPRDAPALTAVGPKLPA